MPNVSPKGTIIPWKEDIVFADIKSPQTIENLRTNPHVEINVVDPILRKGFRFRGRASILTEGSEYGKIISYYKDIGIKSKIHTVVLVRVEKVKEITSPLYDLGYTEDQIKSRWKSYYLSY